jgi:3-oxoacyl-[acyl-carrier-protein] synthase-3
MSKIGGISITGMAAALPSGSFDHDEMVRRFGERGAETIAKMSGIMRRRVASPNQQASDLALTAAERLIRHTKIDRAEIDLLLFVSITPDYRSPSTACVLHGKLGLSEKCAAFDINQACSAFPYALGVAYSMIRSGLCRCALVLNGEVLTRLVHPQDRSLAMLHSDGAAATLVSACETGYGFEAFRLGTDGKGAKNIIALAGGFRLPSSADTKVEMVDAAGCVRTDEHLMMDGPAVFHFSVYKVPEAIRETLRELAITIDDIDNVILHQANKTMMDLIYKSLKVPPEKRFYCLEQMGNCGGPSTAVALSEAWRQGKVRPGSRTLICSFGAGLAWGVAVIKWPENANPVADLDPVVPDDEMLSAAL